MLAPRTWKIGSVMLASHITKIEAIISPTSWHDDYHQASCCCGWKTEPGLKLSRHKAVTAAWVHRTLKETLK